jgi:hypothetical protein
MFFNFLFICLIFYYFWLYGSIYEKSPMFSFFPQTFLFISPSFQLFPLLLMSSGTWLNWKYCLSWNVEGKISVRNAKIHCPQVKWNMYGSTGYWNALHMCVSLAFLAVVASGQFQQLVTESPESPWTGRWMPHPPHNEHVDIHDREHAVRMGVVTTKCDDAKVCKET